MTRYHDEICVSSVPNRPVRVSAPRVFHADREFVSDEISDVMQVTLRLMDYTI